MESSNEEWKHEILSNNVAKWRPLQLEASGDDGRSFTFTLCYGHSIIFPIPILLFRFHVEKWMSPVEHNLSIQIVLNM